MQTKVDFADSVCAEGRFAAMPDLAWKHRRWLAGLDRAQFGHAGQLDPVERGKRPQWAFTQQKVATMTFRYIPAILMLLCLMTNNSQTTIAQQQPLSNGPLQPTVIGQAGDISNPAAGNAGQVDDFPSNSAQSQSTLSPANNGLQPNNGLQAGNGVNPGFPPASQGFPADFRAVGRSGANIDPANPNPTMNPLDAGQIGSNQSGINPTGSDFNAMSSGPSSPGQVPSAQWNNAGGTASPFAPATSGFQSDQTSPGVAGDQHADDHPNHDPAFHVDSESQIDRANRTDGTGLSVGPIRNPAISPLFGQSNAGQAASFAAASSDTNSQANPGFSQNMQPIQRRSDGQTVDASASNLSPSQQSDPVGQDWSQDSQQAFPSGLAAGSQSHVANQSANSPQLNSADASSGNAMQRMLGQSNTQPANLASSNPQNINAMTGETGVASNYRTASPLQDINGLQQPPRLGGTGTDASRNYWMNGGGFGGANNANATNSNGMYNSNGQLASDRSPVISGGRGDYAAGNPMLPMDQSVTTGNRMDAMQTQTELNAKRGVVEGLSPVVQVDLPLSGPSGAFLASQNVGSNSRRQDAQKPTSDLGNAANGVGNPPQTGNAVNGTLEEETKKNVQQSLESGWLLFFFISLGLNFILGYLLVETRNNYRDLADEMQDRFFRESNV